jgi:undecaprenyl-diphosphatase
MIKYIFLGIIQGITEFFPVSSSAHLVIIQKVLGMSGREVVISVILHLGTAIALVIFFFKDILRLLRNKKLLLFIIVVSIITGIIGILGKDFFESLFSSVKLVAGALIITGIILIFTRKFMDARRDTVTLKDALALGLMQGVAIVPGISRSGITISTLLFRKIDRETSFRLSFLASILPVFGATILEARKISGLNSLDLKNLTVGFIFSFITGMIALRLLKLILRKAKLYYFGYYCIIVAAITLVFI